MKIYEEQKDATQKKLKVQEIFKKHGVIRLDTSEVERELVYNGFSRKEAEHLSLEIKERFHHMGHGNIHLSICVDDYVFNEMG